MFARHLLANPLFIFSLSGVLVIAGFWWAYQFVKPAPPERIVISTGNEEGAYYLYAWRYRELLERSHITLDIVTSSGSIENIKRLKTPDSNDSSEVDIAFVQSGSHPVGEDDTLLSIGSLYYEPLWIFYRNDSPVRYLTRLSGKTIAVGEPGSGTRPVVLRLLEASDVNREPTTMVDIGGQAAADALLAGEVDAAFFIAGAQSQLIRRLLEEEDIALMDFARAKAYERLYPYFSALTLPEGVIDLRQNIPAQDTTLIAATANLVVRSDFHPALIDLLLQAATNIHSKGGLFEEYGEFPSSRYLEFPLSPDAERFYRRGPPLLKRYLPFWLATFIERMLVMVIPVLAVLFPLFKLAPSLYQWAVRSKVYRWYKAVKAVEKRSREKHTVKILKALLQDLDTIEAKVNEISVPLAYSDQLYNLRMHINLVRTHLNEEIDKKELKTDKR